MFERLFGRKGEKKNPMDQFKSEEENHDRIGILYSTSDKLDLIKKSYDMNFVTISGMHESRIRTIVDQAADFGQKAQELQASAVCVIIPATQQQILAAQMGLIKIDHHGMSFCPECLKQAIFACEELVTSLKDLQEATKEYCK